LRLGFAILLGLHRLAEAVAFAIHLEDVAAMRQAIQKGRCHPFALKHLIPFAERQRAPRNSGVRFAVPARISGRIALGALTENRDFNYSVVDWRAHVLSERSIKCPKRRNSALSNCARLPPCSRSRLTRRLRRGPAST